MNMPAIESGDRVGRMGGLFHAALITSHLPSRASICLGNALDLARTVVASTIMVRQAGITRGIADAFAP